jgi:hypothetical protein
MPNRRKETNTAINRWRRSAHAIDQRLFVADRDVAPREKHTNVSYRHTSRQWFWRCCPAR